jgi:hypothetical protein
MGTRLRVAPGTYVPAVAIWATEIPPSDLYGALQKSVAKSRLSENAIDSRMRTKTTTYSDVRQTPCWFYWHGLLRFTLDRGLPEVSP